MYTEMLEVAKSLVKECGEYLRTSKHTTIQIKENIQDLVTEKDKAIESYLIHQLSKHYPTHTFLGEESRQEDGENLWIIDPIDGTTNFITSHKDFAISLAYYHHHQPVFGIVYDVMKDELFVGIEHEGAYLNGVKLENLQPRPLSQCILDVSMHSMVSIKKHLAYDLLDLQPRIRGHRSLGCASLSIVHIAQGILDIYISHQVKCWDYAAAVIILSQVHGAYQIQKNFFTNQAGFALFTNQKKLKDILWNEIIEEK